jgi:hypothetical protein
LLRQRGVKSNFKILARKLGCKLFYGDICIMENEVEQLKHRLAMIEDDLRVIRAFVYEQGLNETFQKPTPMADECWTHLNNMEIACDLSSDESLTWKLFSE